MMKLLQISLGRITYANGGIQNLSLLLAIGTRQSGEQLIGCTVDWLSQQ